MLYVVSQGLGAAVLTGAFGCGKTVIARSVLKELSSEKYKSVFISNPRLDEVDLLRMIAYQLGATEPPASKTDVLNTLQDILLNNARNGKQTLIIIDEAHSIDKESVFEEIRLLLNFQLEDRFLLTLILMGQPELKDKVNRNIQLEQRVNIKCSLGSLNAEETKGYIDHRLKIANRTEPVFSERALHLIHSYSGGIPRRINRLCDLCLLTGFVRTVSQIDEDIVREEIKELE